MSPAEVFAGLRHLMEAVGWCVCVLTGAFYTINAGMRLFYGVEVLAEFARWRRMRAAADARIQQHRKQR